MKGRVTGNLDDGRVVFGSKPTAAETKARDPVCGMLVDPSSSSTAMYGGHSYFFCSPDCREKFKADPPSYLK
jgi:P-type Cu+ transporter